ncbi:MAG: DUF1214 domain-containing protein [Flavobacteriaceae bacterium]
MLFLFQIIAGLVIGAALGLGSAFLAVDRGIGFEAVRAGAWAAWPRAGEADADPYTRASLSRTGDLPLAGGAGITFSAKTDDNGDALRADCVYQLSGRMPATQWWTLTVYDDSSGRLISNSLQRYGLSSTEIVRRADGSFDIIISRSARAGNWLPVGRADEIRFLVRLYDTPIATGKSFLDIRMPSIQRLECRS